MSLTRPTIHTYSQQQYYTTRLKANIIPIQNRIQQPMHLTQTRFIYLHIDQNVIKKIIIPHITNNILLITRYNTFIKTFQ